VPYVQSYRSFLKTSCMEGANTLVIISTIDLYAVLQSIVYILIFLHILWMLYNILVKDLSEYIQTKGSAWIRALLKGNKEAVTQTIAADVQIKSIEEVLSDSIEEIADSIEEIAKDVNTPVKHDIREYINRSNKRVIEHTFNDSYKILEIYDILTKEECASMIAAAKEHEIERSEVIDGVYTNLRNSFNIFLEDSTGDVFKTFAKAAADLTGMPTTHQEETQIVFYMPGGYYRAHYDGCEEMEKESCLNFYGNAGDRLASLLVYINDDYVGGKTEFTKVGFSVTPEIGKGILFYNIDENEKLIYESEHTGTDVIEGNKWIATKWVHIRPFV
jgi:prolyl 4-hydroxylase